MLDGEQQEKDEKEYFELDNFDDALQKANANIILPEDNLEKYFIDYIKEKRQIPKVKIRDNEKIVKIDLDNITILSKANKNLPSKYIKMICEKANIPFKNQCVGTLILEIQNKFYQPIRKNLTSEQKKN